MKRIVSFIIAALMCISLAVPAFASTTDTPITNFEVYITSYRRLENRKKDNSSAIYFWYKEGNRTCVRARALGGHTDQRTDTMYNCTYVDGAIVNYVTLFNGNKYSIHSQIHEKGYAYATVSLSCPGHFSEMMSGFWSPDSKYTYTDARP